MKVQVLGNEVFEPHFSRNVMLAWESFMVNGDTGDARVRDVVRDSWARCRDAQVAVDRAAEVEISGRTNGVFTVTPVAV